MTKCIPMGISFEIIQVNKEAKGFFKEACFVGCGNFKSWDFSATAFVIASGKLRMCGGGGGRGVRLLKYGSKNGGR